MALGGAQQPGPCLPEPGLAPCGLAMSRPQAGLGQRKPHVGQPRPHVLAVVAYAKLPPEQHAEEPGGPTGGLTAYDEWPCVDQRPSALLLRRGPLRAATATMAVDQAVKPPPPQGLRPAIEAGWAEAPARTHHRHGHGRHEAGNQDRGPPHHTHIIAPLGRLQTAEEVFDSGATERYPEAHGGLLLGCLASVL
jgi:hypothetical protein